MNRFGDLIQKNSFSLGQPILIYIDLDMDMPLVTL